MTRHKAPASNGTRDGSGASLRAPGSQTIVGWLTAASSVGTNMANVGARQIPGRFSHTLDEPLCIEFSRQRPKADDDRLEPVPLRFQAGNGQLCHFQLNKGVGRQCHIDEFKAPGQPGPGRYPLSAVAVGPPLDVKARCPAGSGAVSRRARPARGPTAPGADAVFWRLVAGSEPVGP